MGVNGGISISFCKSYAPFWLMYKTIIFYILKGNIPVLFFKSVEKCCGYSNPKEYTIIFTGSAVCSPFKGVSFDLEKAGLSKKSIHKHLYMSAIFMVYWEHIYLGGAMEQEIFTSDYIAKNHIAWFVSRIIDKVGVNFIDNFLNCLYFQL